VEKGFGVAILEKPGNRYRLKFSYDWRRNEGPLATTDHIEAFRLKAKLERNLGLLSEGQSIPGPHDDLFRFLLSGVRRGRSSQNCCWARWPKL
jgi:hypothetical protein